MTQHYIDAGAVHPTPLWVKVLAFLFAGALVFIYMLTTARVIPEVQTNREYGKCLFAMLVEHRDGNLKYDTEAAKAHGISNDEIEKLTEAQDFQHYRGLSSDVLCKNIYRNLRDELDLQTSP